MISCLIYPVELGAISTERNKKKKNRKEMHMKSKKRNTIISFWAVCMGCETIRFFFFVFCFIFDYYAFVLCVFWLAEVDDYIQQTNEKRM